MARNYTKVKILAEEVFRRKEAGETNREIGELFGLSKYQIKQLVARENRKRRKMESGYLPKPQGRPRKKSADAFTQTQEELKELRMQVELLQNFLYEVGRR